MQARIVGFDLTILGPVSYADFWDDLPWNLEREFRKQDRFLYFAEADGLHVGLMISAKDHKSSCRLSKTEGAIRVTVSKPAPGETLADYNVFVLHPTTQRGFYLQYRGSCAVKQFGDLLQRLFHSTIQKKRAAAVEAVEEGPTSKRANEVRKLYKTAGLQLTQWIRSSELADLLARLSRIDEFEFEFSALVPHTNLFSPLTGAVKREVHKIQFLPKVTANSIRNALKNLIPALGINSGTIRGPNSCGSREAIHLAQNPDVFATFDFDTITDDQAFNLSDIKESSLVQRVIAEARGHATLLSMVAK
ncbi:hypothetical protein [Anatilimnocola floriformis]|uniref:hypothetical protein n=1 Tax=Anatilimnocola floriformis TaxID=2948575 RepID=UPI0020C465A7|nr:hypothetical protein [Anatilimnocola floriformis]